MMLHASKPHRLSGWVLRRWTVVAAAIVALTVLTQVSLAETERHPLLGVRAARAGDRLTVEWVQPAGWAWDAGIRPGDTVIAVGDRPIGDRDGPAAVERASALRVRSPAGRETVATVATVAAYPSARYLPVFLILATTFVVVGGAVFILADDRAAAWVFLGFAGAWATALIVAVAIPFGRPWALGLEYVAVVGFGITTLLLFLAFPVNYLRTRLGRWIATWSGVISAALVVAYCRVLFTDTAAYAILQPLLHVVLALELLAASGLMAAAFARTAPGQRPARRALGLVALGAVAGLLPFCLLGLLPQLLGYGYLVQPSLAILSVGVLPLSLGIAILSRQFLGVTRLVRRGLIALVVWIGLLGGYSIALGALRREFGPASATLAATLDSTVLGIAVVAASFTPLQHRLRRALERRLFRDVYDYKGTLARVGQEIAQLTSLDAIAGHALARLGRTLDLCWTAIALRADPLPALLYRWGDCPADLAPLACLADMPSAAEVGASRGDLAAHHTPLIVDGAAIGTLAIGPKRHDIELLPEDRELIATLAPLLAASLQNALLVRRLEGQITALGERERELAALSARLLRAQEEERRRIALDLHDDPLQRTILLTRKVGAALACPQAREWHQDTEEIGDSLRAICLDLRPPVLDDLGLVAGLEQLVAGLRPRADLVTCFAAEGPDGPDCGRLPGDLEVALYRVAQEALNNCLKHARATTVRVTLRREGRRVTLRVADDGRGYDAGAAREAPGHPLHLGILGMRERLRPWGGDLAVERAAAGGTVVTAAVEVGGCDGRTA